MPSFSFSSLAMCSSPQVGFSHTIWRINALDVFRQMGPSHWPGLPPPEQTEPLAVPSDQGLGLDHDQRVAPVEPPAQEAHEPACGIVGPVGFVFALLKQGKLLAQKQVLSLHGAPGPARHQDQSKKIQKHAERCPDQMAERLQPSIQEAHERSRIARPKTPHTTATCGCGDFLRTTALPSALEDHRHRSSAA